jgi:medium-chain acyl-[acyl-carrier-protein] hydrolase
MSKPAEPWIVRPRPNPGAAIRMFCFPYAGVGVSVYRTWPAALASSIEFVAMQPPGREGRWGEKPFQRLDALVASAADALLPHLTTPFVFFGHSLGALVGFEVARKLRRDGRPQPLHLFASAHRAPHLPNPHPEIRMLSDADFVDQLCKRYGGIPQTVLDNPDLLELMLPCLRADFSVFETYTYSEEPPLACRITAYGGTRDRRVSEPEVRAWERQTTGGFRCEMFSGEHFFIQDGRDAVLASIMSDIEALTPQALDR